MLPGKSQIKKGVGALVLILLCGIVLPVFAGKPQPPLQLHLATTPLPNHRIELTLDVTAQMDVSSAELLLQLPESLVLVDGTPKWTGPMAAGEKKTLILLLQTLSTLPSMVIAEGTVALPGGGSFTQHSTLGINERRAPSSPSPLEPVRQKQGDHAVLEFSGQ